METCRLLHENSSNSLRNPRIRSSRPHVVASATCFTLRSHVSAAPPQGNLTPALGPNRMITVTEKESSHSSNVGSKSTKVGNKIAWLPHENGKLILAVGDPEQWGSSLPLPSNSVLTDLIQASLSDIALASELWGVFFIYIYYKSNPSPWKRFFVRFTGLNVHLSIEDRSVLTAVEKSIRQCKTHRISLVAA